MTRKALTTPIIFLLLAGSASALQPVGAFLLPRSVAGHSTAYSAGTLTIRTVNGQQRLFSDAGGLIYEATVPALRSKPPYLTARVLRTWGTAYAGGHLHEPALRLRLTLVHWRAAVRHE
jgi:hypothetical protein